MKHLIKIKDKSKLGMVHGSVWACRFFNFEPFDFMTETDKLNQRLISAKDQEESLNDFLKKPKSPVIYIVSGNPDDSRAKYFAAFLADHHINSSEFSDVHWENINGHTSFNSGLARDMSPTMIILSGVTTESTHLKLEKCRDLIERWPNIPRIVVCCGEDPVSFASTRLRVPAHAIAYLPSGGVKTVQEII